MKKYLLSVFFGCIALGMTTWPAAASTVELQFSDNLSNNFGDSIDILITTTSAPGPYPSSGTLITDITGTGFLSYNFGPPVGLFKYPVSLTGLPVGFGADNLLFRHSPSSTRMESVCTRIRCWGFLQISHCERYQWATALDLIFARPTAYPTTSKRLALH